MSIRITSLTSFAAVPASDDVIPIVDVSDTTQGPTGTTKKIAVSVLSSATTLNGFALRGGYITATAAANELTVAVKALSGNDPSSSEPVSCVFRNATAASGATAEITLTGPLDIVIPSGAEMGVTANVAFRIWVAIANDGGTARLVVINVRGTSNVVAIRDDMLITSTTIGTGSDAALTFYSDAGVTAKAIRVVGYLEYSSGLATPGTWASAPTKIQVYMPGMSLPGEVIQVRHTSTVSVVTGTTAIPIDDTIPQNTEGDQYLSQQIDNLGSANMLRIRASLQLSHSATVAMGAAIFVDSVANAVQANFGFLAAGEYRPREIEHWMPHNSTATSRTFSVRAGGSTGATTTLNGISGGRFYGGAAHSWLSVEEIMA